MAEAARHSAESARRAGDHREETIAWGWVISGVDLGPTPVGEAIDICERIVAAAAEDAWVRAYGVYHLGYLHARGGRLDEARRLSGAGRGLMEKKGVRI